MKSYPARIAFALGGLAGLAIVWSSIYAKGWHSEETAAWVGALGSIAAVSVAFWIGHRDSQKFRERQQLIRDEVGTLAWTCLEAVVHATNLVEIEPRHPKKDFTRSQAELADLSRNLEAVPTYDLEAKEAASVREFRFLLTATQGLLRDSLEDGIDEDSIENARSLRQQASDLVSDYVE